MLQARSLELENFLSFEEARYQFPVPGSVILVQGENSDAAGFESNASGKSAFFEALIWVLTGTTPRLAYADDVVRHGALGCAVRYVFEQDGSLYRVERYRGDLKYHNNVFLFRDDVPVPSKSVEQTQQEINKLFGLSYESLLQTVLFMQGASSRFTSCSDGERKKVLEDLLDLSIYSRALTLTVRDKRLLETRLRTAEQARAAVMQELAVQKENLLDAERTLHDAEMSDNSLVEAKHKKEIQGKIAQMQNQMIMEKGKLVALKNRCEALKRTFDRAHEATREALNKEGKAEAKTKQLFPQRKELMDHLTLAKQQKESKRCAACGQLIPKSHAIHLQDLQSKLNTIQRLIEQSNKDYMEACSLSKDLLKKENAIDQELRHTAAVQYHTEETIRKLASLAGELTRELAQKTSDGAVKALEAGVKRFRAAIEQAEKKLKLANKECTTAATSMETILFWEKGFGNAGIKSLLLDNALPLLNDSANRYATALTDGELQIEFDTEVRLKAGARDRFDVRVIRSNGLEKYTSASGGERRRADLCVALALRDLAPSCNVLVFDELFDALDEAGVGEVVKLLHDYAKTNSVIIYLITHLPHLKALFEHVLLIHKENGISSLVQT